MKALFFVKSGLFFLLVVAGVSSQGSTDQNSLAKKMPQEQHLGTDYASLERPVEIKDSIIDKGYVLLRTDSASPVKLINVSPITNRSDFKKGVSVEVLNTSSKTVAFTDLAVSVPPTCLSFYLAGDSIVNQRRSDGQLFSKLEKRSLPIPGDVAKAYFPSEQYIKRCPAGERKPVIYVWEVEFTDGSKWSSHPD